MSTKSVTDPCFLPLRLASAIILGISTVYIGGKLLSAQLETPRGIAYFSLDLVGLFGLLGFIWALYKGRVQLFFVGVVSYILFSLFHVARRTYATIFFSENRQSIIEECLKDHPKFELKDCEDGYQSAYINAIVVQVVLVLITIYYNIVLIQTYRHMKRFPEQYPANSWSSVKPISSVSNNPTYPDANYRQEPFGIQTMNAGHSLPVYTPPYSLGKGSEDIELAPVNGNTPPTNPNAGR